VPCPHARTAPKDRVPCPHARTAPKDRSKRSLGSGFIAALIAAKMEFITVCMYIPMQHRAAGSGVCRLAGHAQIPPHTRYCAGCCLERKSASSLSSLEGHRTEQWCTPQRTKGLWPPRMLLHERSRVLQRLFTATSCQPRRRHCTLRGATALRL